MINLFNIFKEQFIISINKIANQYNITLEDKYLKNIVVEPCKDSSHGHIASNTAMVMFKNFTKTEIKNPLNLANLIIDKLDKVNISDIKIANPGFINIIIKQELLHKVTYDLISKKEIIFPNLGNFLNVNLEYASPNPTGPIHIGHCRGAIYGDILANLLTKVGYNILREYYINDAGNQITALLESAFIRYQQSCGIKVEISEGLYPGQYLIEIGDKIKQKFGNELLSTSKDGSLSKIRDFVINEILDLIKSDLGLLGIKHDSYFSEKKLIHDQGKISEVIEILNQKNLIYKGIIQAPKSNKVSNSDDKDEQLLFRSTEFGDDQDRVILKSDGSPTYFAADIAYTKSKIDRGANIIIMPLGYDHSGYVKRLEAACKILSDDKVQIKIILCQLVKFVKDNQPLKMSKRAGNFITARQVVEEIGADILRFLMLMRKNDAMFDFDLQKAIEKSKDNPIFYVQYAYARCCSIIKNLQEQDIKFYQNIINFDIDGDLNFLKLLKDESEIELMLKIANFSRIIEMSVRNFELHIIAFYIEDLAASFHALWHKGAKDDNLKFIMFDNFDQTKARLSLVIAVKNLIAVIFEIFNIKPVEEMK